MRWILALLLCLLISCASPPRSDAAAIKVDHITLCGPGLAQMIDAFASAGIVTEYGGKHANGITEMALSSFPDGSYFELIAPQPGVDASPHYWAKYMTGGSGACGWALTSTQMEADVLRLKSAGIAIGRDTGGRKRPDGTELRWETATVGPPPQGSFFPFLIHDLTDRNLRAFPKGAPTTTAISGVHAVVIGVRDLDDAVAQYRKAFALPAPELRDDASLKARLARFAETPIVLAAPAEAGSWLDQRVARFGENPAAFLLTSPQAFAGEASDWFGKPVTWLNVETGHIGIVK